MGPINLRLLYIFNNISSPCSNQPHTMLLPLIPEAIAHPSPDPRRRRPAGVRVGRRKLPAVRLGGKKPGKVVMLRRLIRRMKVKWLKLQYVKFIKKIKEYYREVVREMAEAGPTLEAYQRRLAVEASFGALNFSSFHYPDRRSYVM